MTRVLHVIDPNCDETVAQTLEALRARLNGEDRRHTVCSIDPVASVRVASHIHDPIVHASRPFGPLQSPKLSAFMQSASADLIHAWGIRAAVVCNIGRRDLPILISLLDPEITPEAADWARSFPEPVTIAAGSQMVRSRLVTAGVSADQIVVIRGPVDFGAINRARETETRRQIVGAAAPVILLNGPSTRDGGQYTGLWAAAIVRELYPELTVLMPYESRDSGHLKRFARAIADPSFLTVPDSRLSWAELASCAISGSSNEIRIGRSRLPPVWAASITETFSFHAIGQCRSDSCMGDSGCGCVQHRETGSADSYLIT